MQIAVCRPPLKGLPNKTQEPPSNIRCPPTILNQDPFCPGRLFHRPCTTGSVYIVTSHMNVSGACVQLTYLDWWSFLSMSSRSVGTGTPYLEASHTVLQASARFLALSRSAARAASSCSDVRTCSDPNAEEKALSSAASLALAHSTPRAHASLLCGRW